MGGSGAVAWLRWLPMRVYELSLAAGLFAKGAALAPTARMSAKPVWPVR